jgi:hypothetical protein
MSEGTVDKILDIAGALVPPKSSDDPEQVRRWRIALVLFLGANMVFNLFHVAWACGWLTTFGLMGFAKAEDVDKMSIAAITRQNSLEQSLKDMRLLQVSNALKEALKTRCLAVLQNNQTALDGANTEIQSLQNQYFSLMSRGYYEPSCAVVLIAKVP